MSSLWIHSRVEEPQKWWSEGRGGIPAAAAAPGVESVALVGARPRAADGSEEDGCCGPRVAKRSETMRSSIDWTRLGDGRTTLDAAEAVDMLSAWERWGRNRVSVILKY